MMRHYRFVTLQRLCCPAPALRSKRCIVRTCRRCVTQTCTMLVRPEWSMLATTVIRRARAPFDGKATAPAQLKSPTELQKIASTRKRERKAEARRSCHPFGCAPAQARSLSVSQAPRLQTAARIAEAEFVCKVMQLGREGLTKRGATSDAHLAFRATTRALTGSFDMSFTSSKPNSFSSCTRSRE